MSTIILDCGFGAQCKNDKHIVRDMVYSIKLIDKEQHKIIFKWQLFTKESIPNLLPLDRDVFAEAFEVAKVLGYETTSSVFDKESLEFLEKFDVPWIKIAARPELHKSLLPLIKKPVIVSVGEDNHDNLWPEDDSIIQYLHCIAKYPATVEDYEKMWNKYELKHSISDHTIGLELFKKYKPEYWEKHYLLKREPIDDPYGNDWYTTPEELKEIL